MSFEFYVNKTLNECRAGAGKVCVKNLPDWNAFKNMNQAGSKGSELNIS